MATSKHDRFSFWTGTYLDEMATRLTGATVMAKRRDLDLLQAFLADTGWDDHLDQWTRGITQAFVDRLEGDAKRRPATINRILASLRHFADWTHERRPFTGVKPTVDVDERFVAEPTWEGLAKREVTALHASLERLTRQRRRKNQRPLRDRAIVLTLLDTGLRVTELLAIDRAQYDGTSFHDVPRKGGRRSPKVRLANRSRAALDRYLAEERGHGDGALFTSGAGIRLERQHVDRVLKFVAAGVKSGSDAESARPLSARDLRHTALRKATRKRGVESGMRKGGHASTAYVWRYVRLTEDERREALEHLSGNDT